MSDKHEELTHDARAAIRSYMLHLVTIPAIFIAILSFAAGFMVKDLSLKIAEIKATLMVQPVIRDATIKVTESVGEANKAVEQAEVLLKEVSTLKDKLKRTEAYYKGDEYTDELIQTLAGDTDFVDKLAANVAGDISELRAIVDGVSDIPKWRTVRLQNGWKHYGDGHSNVGILKEYSGVVHLKGLVKGGKKYNKGEYIFKLPNDCTPTERLIFSVATAKKSAAQVHISTDGFVWVYDHSVHSEGDPWVSLDGISFVASQVGN